MTVKICEKLTIPSISYPNVIEALNMCENCKWYYSCNEKLELDDKLKEFEEAQTFEVCPYCDNEVVLKAEFKPQICPECKKVILPCSICPTDYDMCGKCPLESEKQECK